MDLPLITWVTGIDLDLPSCRCQPTGSAPFASWSEITRMFQSPDHYHNLSLRLSEVLDDIGVNEKLVMRRRRAWLLLETIENIYFQFDENTFVFNFGSQNEGSTTLELKSDIDLLICGNGISVIQDWSEWKLDKVQCLMVQDETTSPGYCLLQAVRSDMPLPDQDIQDQHFITDSRGRVLMKNSVLFQRMTNGRIRHGPSQSLPAPGRNHLDVDFILALYCSSWPKAAESWLQQRNVSGWPTEDMKRYASEHGCFVVPVASHANGNENTEWRISTSLAERCLMFSLNMTQIRCYILMKMIIKTYLKPKCGDTITSYMCKTVLFHCIAFTRASEWTEPSLLPRFNQCLHCLLNCVLTENCPHFIIHENNLLAGKLSCHTKQQLVEIMMTLTANIEQSLLGISIDKLGNRLHVKLGRMVPNYLLPLESISAEVLSHNALCLTAKLNCMLLTNSHKNGAVVFRSLVQNVCKLSSIYSTGSRLEQAACCLYTPLLCASIGSIIASVNIHRSQPVFPEALMFFSAGLNSDFSSSKLKFASALYCAGHYEQCESILARLNRQLEQTTVLTVCRCNPHNTIDISEEYGSVCLEKNEVSVIQENIAFCVSCFPCELNCVPKDLKYELFRSTDADLPYRGTYDNWMDCAVVDSIPFLYFLQYKVNNQLNRPAQQEQALHNLARTISDEINLGHRETALNLNAQCMEKENRKDDAFCCYMMSLKIRPWNNVAKWHICKLLARLFNNRT